MILALIYIVLSVLFVVTVYKSSRISYFQILLGSILIGSFVGLIAFKKGFGIVPMVLAIVIGVILVSIVLIYISRNKEIKGN